MARSPLTRLRIFGRIFWELRVDNSEIYKRSLLLLIFYIAALYSLPISGLHSPLYPPNMVQVLLFKKKFFTGLNQILPSLQCNNLVCILIKQYWAGSPFLSLNVSPAICVVYQEQSRPANPETPPPPPPLPQSFFHASQSLCTNPARYWDNTAEAHWNLQGHDLQQRSNTSAVLISLTFNVS